MLKKKDQLQQKIVKVEATMDSSVEKIKKTTISKQEIEKMYNAIVNTCEALVGEINRDKNKREEKKKRLIC